MKIALLAAESEDNKIRDNLRRLKEWGVKAKEADAHLALFGEAYLQGFEGLNFNYDQDIHRCLSLGSPEIAELCQFAKKNELGLGFGYYENYRGAIYSSYMVIHDSGRILCNYRRVSKGWKTSSACADYREGKSFSSFSFHDKRFVPMICGDFWEDDLLGDLVAFDDHVDAYLWPVHCDYDPRDWKEAKLEYEARTAIFSHSVLYINSYCKGEGRAKGGLYHWKQGKTLAEKKMGKESMLLLDL